jgi:cytoskeleton protein RodZ
MSEPIGVQLTRLRGLRGLSTAAVATALRCDPKIIDALENERWAELGAPVFSRGHLRRYAEFLGVPADPLLEQWNAEQGASTVLPDLSRVPQAPRPLDTQRWGRRLAMLAGAFVIALAAWWILQGAEMRPAATPAVTMAAAEASVTTPSAQTPSTETPSVPVVPEVSAVPDLSAPADIAADLTAPNAPVPDTAAPVVATPAVAAPSVPGDGVAVVFTASEPCWAEVVDATGARRLYAMLQPGQRVSVQGAPPLRVLLGRGDATALEISGSAAVIPADAVRNSVARFEIAASGAMRALPPEPRPEPAPSATPQAAGSAETQEAPAVSPAPGGAP